MLKIGEPKEGEIICAFCYKAFSEKDAVTRTIRGFTNKYCSKECSADGQMASEG